MAKSAQGSKSNKKKDGTREAGGGFSIGGVVEFFRSSVEEIKKVDAPTRQETIQATVVVMVIMFLMAAYLGLLDLIFNEVMQSIL